MIRGGLRAANEMRTNSKPLDIGPVSFGDAKSGSNGPPTIANRSMRADLGPQGRSRHLRQERSEFTPVTPVHPQGSTRTC